MIKLCEQFSGLGWLLTKTNSWIAHRLNGAFGNYFISFGIGEKMKVNKWQWMIRVCLLKDQLQIAKTRMNTFGSVRCETFTSVIECQVCWNAYLIHFPLFIIFPIHTVGISCSISTDSVWQIKRVTQYRIYQMLKFSWGCTLKALLMCISCYINF